MSTVKDRYKVKLPSDLYDRSEGWLENMCQAAIREADERTRLWCRPCMWEAVLISGDEESWECEFLVTRTRRKRTVARETEALHD
jgi:hypothetical protein